MLLHWGAIRRLNGLLTIFTTIEQYRKATSYLLGGMFIEKEAVHSKYRKWSIFFFCIKMDYFPPGYTVKTLRLCGQWNVA